MKYAYSSLLICNDLSSGREFQWFHLRDAIKHPGSAAGGRPVSGHQQPDRSP